MSIKKLDTNSLHFTSCEIAEKLNEIIDLLNFITSPKLISESKRVTFCVEVPDSDKAV
jgi:hypothetical protein